MSTRIGPVDLDAFFFKRAIVASFILHGFFLLLKLDYDPPKIEVRDDAIKVTIATPEEIKKNKALKIKSPTKESETKVMPKEKVIAGTQKVVPNAKTLGNPKADKVVKNVQKGDPLSKKMTKYKPGTDFRKLRATSIGTGGTSKLETANKVGGGSGDTYKGLDFSVKSMSAFAKKGNRFAIKGAADDMGAGAGRDGGIGDGQGRGFGDGVITGTNTGTIEKAKILDNVGSLTGATVGEIASSKGAEGLSQRGTIVLAGTPEETVILGSMDPELIRRILMDHLSQFRYCYQSELESSTKPDSLAGVIDLNFTINASGNTQNIKVLGNQNLTSKIKGCVAGVLRSIQFPSPKGGGVVEVKQPMNFYSKGL